MNFSRQKELQMLQSIKDGKGYDDGEASVGGFSEFLKERRLNVESRVSLSVEAANALMAKLRVELEPFRMITHEMWPFLETVLLVEKRQQLRSIRIQKLNKQGHFLPEEDDKFLERVGAAVEEEEQQVILAADIDAAKDAIATVEQSGKTTENVRPDSMDESSDGDETKESKDQTTASTNSGPSTAVTNKDSGKQVSQEDGHSGA